MKRPPVRTKIDFARRYKEGEFGNASPTWDTKDEYVSSGYRGLVHIRNRVAGAATWYNVSALDFGQAWKVATERFRPEQLYISAMAPTEKTVIQGEAIIGCYGLELLYTTIPLPMRDALRKESHVVRGIVASILLRSHLCPNSHEWLMCLLSMYPDHAVEFSTYSVNWGTLPHYNTVFWEVRLY